MSQSPPVLDVNFLVFVLPLICLSFSWLLSVAVHHWSPHLNGRLPTLPTPGLNERIDAEKPNGITKPVGVRSLSLTIQLFSRFCFQELKIGSREPLFW